MSPAAAKASSTTRSPKALRRDADQIRATGDRLGKVLWVVGGSALVFTAATVTQFAITHGVPWYIAWLLDPMVSLALLVVLVGDAVLARHRVRVGGWCTVVKFGTAAATWAMNVWESVAKLDAAGILLHSVAPALVIGLAEVTPRLRVRFAELADDLDHQAAVLEDPRLGRPTWAPAVGNVEVEHVAVAELTTRRTPPAGALTGSPTAALGATPTAVPTGRSDSATATPTGSPFGSPTGSPSPAPTGRADGSTGSPTGNPAQTSAAAPTGRARTAARPTASASTSTRKSAPAPKAEAVPARRSIEQLRVELAAAIAAGTLPAAPSASQIRDVLGIGVDRARALRDEAATQPAAAQHAAEPAVAPVLAAVHPDTDVDVEPVRGEQAGEVAA